MEVIFEMLKAQRALIQKIGNKVTKLDRMVQDEEAQESMDSDIDYDDDVDGMEDNDAGTVILSASDESDEKEVKSSPEDDVSKEKHWSSLASQRALLAEKAKGLQMNSRHKKKLRNKKARKMIEGSDASQSNSTNDSTDSSGDSGAEGIKRSNVAVKN